MIEGTEKPDLAKVRCEQETGNRCEPGLVSVIIPTHDRAHLVTRAIQSVLEQKYGHLELLVVDDASTDDTRRVVKALADPRLLYARHEQNRGAPAARNTGIEMSSGEYIAFLDSDDHWLPGKLQEQMRVFHRSGPEVGLVYTGIEVVDLLTGAHLKTRVPRHRGHILRELLRHNVVVGSTSTAVIRRTYLHQSGLFDESLPARQDIDLWIRLAKRCSFDFVDQILAVIRVHADRITEDSDARIAGAKLVFEKIRDDLVEEGLLSEGYHFLARELCKSGRMKEGRAYSSKAIRTFPLPIKYYGTFLSSFLGSQWFSRIQHTWGALKGSAPSAGHQSGDSDV